MARPAALTQTEYDAANEQIRFNSATTNLVYDNNGNLTSFTDTSGTTTYTWNARNQLTAISGPGLAASFVYDGIGRRTTKTVNSTTTGYWYDGQDILTELSGSTPTATYLRSLRIDEPFIRQLSGGNEFYQTDALGGTVALTDGTGAAQNTYTYEPFGRTTVSGTSSNPLQYTGRENDGTGLYYYRARYLSPSFARFIREDPIWFGGGSTNFYSYVQNNPLRFIDPYGLVSIVAGGGFSVVGPYGVEGGGGLYFDTSSNSAGYFTSVGAGVGLNVSADAFGGLIWGDLQAVTINSNVVAGPISATFLFDPTTGDWVGFTLGPGYPIPFIPRVGISATISVTGATCLYNCPPPPPKCLGCRKD